MNRVLIMGNVVIGIAMFALAKLEGPAVPEFVLVGLAVIMFCVGVALEIKTRSLANSMNSAVDERERARRDHAHRIAYWTLSFPVGFVGGMLVARLHRTWGDGLGLSVSPEAMPLFLVCFWLGLFLFVTLPTAIVAWTEPHPLDDDAV
ncbi:MAG: hypothetical protein AAGJ52_10335 [Pseudomonadota bacterium]